MPKHLDEGKVRVAVVGCGGIGSLHSDVIRHCSGVKLVSVTDIKAGNELARRLRVKAYQDVTEMVREENLDGLVVATPPHTHLKILKTAIAHGIHCLVEKPVCMGSSEVSEVAALCQKNGALIVPGYSLFFDPTIRIMMKSVLAGDLGELLAGAVTISSPMPTAGWYYDIRLSGGGTLVDKGSHVFPVLLRLFPAISFVDCDVWYLEDSKVEVMSSVRLSFNDRLITCRFSWLEPFSWSRIELFGVGSSWVADNYGMSDFVHEHVCGYSVRKPILSARLARSFSMSALERFLSRKAQMYANEMRFFTERLAMLRVGECNCGTASSCEVPTLEDSIVTWRLIEQAYAEAKSHEITRYGQTGM